MSSRDRGPTLRLTSRTCLTTASDAPNRSTPEMPRTSFSTAPGERFFFRRPGGINDHGNNNQRKNRPARGWGWGGVGLTT